MNYVKEKFYHCVRVIHNHHYKKYCSKWDTLLKEIMEVGEYSIQPNNYTGKVYTIEYKYKDKEYSVWVSNGFYGTGSLSSLDGYFTDDENERRPSFKVQYKLLEIIEEYESDKLKEKEDKFNKTLYGK